MPKAIVTGVSSLLRKLAAKQKAHAGALERGLVKAGLGLQKFSMELVPVDTGNLRGTAFTRKDGSGFTTVVTVGYTAAYAIYVHEDLNVFHPNGQAKYLEEPARTRQREMQQLIREEMKK